MAARRLPDHPNLDQLRKQARALQRGVRTGQPKALRAVRLAAADPVFPLTQAQLVLARRYGFASWARLRRHVDAIVTRSWTLVPPSPTETPAERFVRRACLDYSDGDTGTPLAAPDPGLAAGDLAVAAAGADARAVGELLAADPGAAGRPTGVFDWPPLMYATYTRVPAERDDTLATVGLLLDAGADPNDGRFFNGLPTPFTVLTGALGGGEGDQPPHRHAMPLARLLLSRGAEANDGQTLYNRMFGTDDDFLELLFEFGLGVGDGGPWRRLLPDVLPAPADLVRGLLAWAVTHDQRDRVALLARHGIDVVSPLTGDALGPLRVDDATPIGLALRNGHRLLADQLRALGAREPDLGPVATFVAAALAGDAAAVAGTPPDVVAVARNDRPGLIVWAAAQQRIDAVELLVGAGFDVNALGRSDAPIEQKWETALHAAVQRGNTELVRRLLELGADPELRDTRFDGTARDWADYFDHGHLAELLERPRSDRPEH